MTDLDRWRQIARKHAAYAVWAEHAVLAAIAEAVAEERKGWREKVLRWGTAMPVLATMLDKSLSFGAGNRAREMQKEMSAAIRQAEPGKPTKEPSQK